MERSRKFAAIIIGRVIAHKRHTHQQRLTVSTHHIINDNNNRKKRVAAHIESSYCVSKLIIRDYIFVKLTFLVAHQFCDTLHIVKGLSSVGRCAASCIIAIITIILIIIMIIIIVVVITYHFPFLISSANATITTSTVVATATTCRTRFFSLIQQHTKKKILRIIMHRPEPLALLFDRTKFTPFKQNENHRLMYIRCSLVVALWSTVQQ